jgi:hypothetical protein
MDPAVGEPAVADPAPVAEQSSLAAPPPAARVELRRGHRVLHRRHGQHDPILDAVKANALRFYDDVQDNLTATGKNVDGLRVRVIGDCPGFG